MQHFVSKMDLSDIGQIGGFRMQGAASDDYAGFNFGFGDVNGDGLSDLIVCSDGFDGGGLYAGGAFVIYGKSSGITPSIDFAHLNASDGFVIQGEFAYDLASRDIAGIGDVNGDGIEDMLIGAFKNDEGAFDAGAAYIIYGRATPVTNAVDLYDLDPGIGIKIVGEGSEDYASFWVSSAGDVNGDGRNDMIIGAPQNDGSAANAGAAYVIFGRDTDYTGKIELAQLDPSLGFKISGAAASDYAGYGVGTAGDFNGDGVDDLIVGAPQTGTAGAGAAYVLFGRTDIGPIDLSQLTPQQGFIIRGESSQDGAGYNVAGAGDVNGDGRPDLIVGATGQDSGGSEAGAAYVIFGTPNAYANGLNLSDLNGTNGFKIIGAAAGSEAGINVSTAGDVNGDGYADILVGAWRSAELGAETGSAYLLFGSATGFAPVVNLASLDPRQGIKFVGEVAGGQTGRAVSSAGDINGDGFADIAIGSPGDSTPAHLAGAAYVIYGRPSNQAPTAIDSRVLGGEHVPYAFATSDFGFSDSDGDRLATVQIVTLPTRGALMLRDPNGGPDTPVATGQWITAADIAAGRLVFQGEPNTSGIDYATLGFKVQDDGGVVGYGQDTSVAAAHLTIDLRPDTSGPDGVLTGTNGDDTLVGIAATAVMKGLLGNDTYLINSAEQQVFEDAGGGTDTIRTTVSYTLAEGSEVELLEAADPSSTVGLVLRGNEFDNVIHGASGADSIVGGGGADVLVGYGGDDSYLVQTSSDRVIEALGGGRDTVYATGDYILTPGSEVETLLAYDRTATFAQNLTANEYDNVVQGSRGDNVLDGGGGNDTMYGFAGNDTFYVDSPGDLPIELYGEGFDTIITSVSYVMPQGMEFEVLRTIDPASTAAINLTGNKLPNTLIGNAGANILDGLGGGDDMSGLQGDDVYIVRRANDRVHENVGEGHDTIRTLVSYALAAGSEIEVLAAYDQSSTNALVLTGNEFANAIYGAAGNDAIIGGGGADMLYGLGGNDSYLVSDPHAMVFEAVGGGYDTVYTTGSFSLSAGSEVEVLTVYDRASTDAINLNGNEFANVIYGNAGNNVLTGGGGADTFFGLGGDDEYHVDSADDMVIEWAGGGHDTVLTTVSYALASGQEIEELAPENPSATTGLVLTGNEFDNTIYGGAGNDGIIGGGGADTLVGRGGDDAYLITDPHAVVIERVGEGYDTVYTTASYTLAAGSAIEALTVYDRSSTDAIDLTGNEFDNMIYGDAGNNRLDGGLGNDTLVGVAGADTFIFSSALGPGNVDTIVSFASGLDRIELHHDIFAALGMGALQAAQFTIGTQAQDADDRIIYDPVTGALSYDADGLGGADAVHFATLQPATSIVAGDFFVI